jgi:hypothetical protein
MYRRTCRVETIVQQVGKMLERSARAGGIRVEFHLESRLPYVYCDPDQIGRVIVNMAMNAMRFTKRDEYLHLWARYEKTESEVHVGVTDNGHGVSPSDGEQLFRDFMNWNDEARKSTQGLGIGLKIAKELAALNMGELHVLNAPTRGSVVYVTLPIASPAVVMRRYLSRLRESTGRRSQPFVSLLRVHIDGKPDPVVYSVVERMMENQLRRNDLMLRAPSYTWLLAAATDATGVRQMIQRLNFVCEQTRRDSVEAEIPAIRLEIEGTWECSKQETELAARFEEILVGDAGDRSSPGKPISQHEDNQPQSSPV